MRTIAFDVLEWLDNHPNTTSADKCQLLDQNPAWQWAGDHWFELRGHCQNRVEPGTTRRPANALNVEIGTPADRCLYRSPDGRGLLWYLSGGSVLNYGLCERSACPRCDPEFQDNIKEPNGQ